MQEHSLLECCMPTMRVISREEAQNTRRTKEPGVRRARMDQFDAYAQALIDAPEEAVVYEDIEEDQQKFVLSLRGAFKRAGVPAIVRKMRGRNEVRAWIGEPTPRASRAKSIPAKSAAPARGRGRAKATAQS
jgi:hypothetical protein